MQLDYEISDGNLIIMLIDTMTLLTISEISIPLKQLRANVI